MEEPTVKFINQIFEADIEIGDLLSVEYVVCSDEPKTIEAITLCFKNRVFTVKAITDDDTMEVVSGKIETNAEQNLISASQDKPWSTAIGKSIMWSWALINQQGYPDAIQFEFSKNLSDTSITNQKDISDRSIIIQLLTAASSIYIYELSEISI